MGGSGRATGVSLDAVTAVFAGAADPHAPRTASEVAESLGCARRTAFDKLETLVARGDLETKKVGARGRVWWIPAGSADPRADATSAGTPDDLSRRAQVEAVARRIARSVVRAETRTALEEAACERLADADAYRFAVSGEFSSSFDRFGPRAWAGIGRDYVDEVLGTEAAAPLAEGPGATAAKTGAVQVVRDASDLSDPAWREAAATHGFDSFACVPLVYRDFVYGVLAVFADRDGAFEEAERAVLADVGRLVGDGINALEHRDVVEPAVELTFTSERLARPYVAADADVHIDVESIVPLADGTQLQYWTVTGIPIKQYLDIAEDRAAILDVRFLSTVAETSRVEVHTAPDSIAAAFERFGGRLTSIRREDDDLVVSGEFSRSVDAAAVSSAVHAAYPDLDLSAERPVLTPNRLRNLVEDRLTDRQLTALRMAYFGGYYEQPRGSTGEALADRLGITKQTFHHHRRRAEAEVVARLFEESIRTDRSDSSE